MENEKSPVAIHTISHKALQFSRVECYMTEEGTWSPYWHCTTFNRSVNAGDLLLFKYLQMGYFECCSIEPDYKIWSDIIWPENIVHSTTTSWRSRIHTNRSAGKYSSTETTESCGHDLIFTNILEFWNQNS